MGKTNILTFGSNNRMAKIAWEERLWRDSIKESIVGPLMGGPNSICYTKENGTKGKGDVIYFGLRKKLAQAAVVNGTLEGNETSLSTYSFSVTLNKHRFGIRNESEMDEVRAAFSIPTENIEALKERHQEYMEEQYWDSLYDSPSSYAYCDASNAFATGTVLATVKTALTAVATSKLNAQFLSKFRGHLKARRGDGYCPIKPVKIPGYAKPVYIMIVHPYSLTELWNDGTFLTGHRECLARAKDHPIFYHGSSIYGGFVIMESENAATFSDAGAGSINGCHAKVLGERGLCMGRGRTWKIVRKTFDYDDETGYGASAIFGLRKSTFNSVDYGSVSALFAHDDLS